MKVIEHGKVFQFECSACGCKYSAGVNETRDCGFYRESVCPECGTLNKYGEMLVEDGEQR